MKVEGASALVAGGASGLGAATARALHERGASVVIADLNAEKGEALASELGDRATFVEANVLEAEQVQAAVDAAAAHPGGLRICVVCAGTGWAQKIASSKGPHPLMPFETIIAINLVGTFNAWRLAAAAMLPNAPDEQAERGVLIGTASVAAFDGQVGQTAYAASKGALHAAMFSMAKELGPKKIRVNMVVPTWMWGPNVELYVSMTAQKRGVSEEEVKASIAKKMPLGEIPEDGDVANAVVFFASDHARMLTGQTLFVNGGEYFR
jgi:NAD(P)-dependent dehydrogenase (short-subunit alcohol dehydrogenase family)